MKSRKTLAAVLHAISPVRQPQFDARSQVRVLAQGASITAPVDGASNGLRRIHRRQFIDLYGTEQLNRQKTHTLPIEIRDISIV